MYILNTDPIVLDQLKTHPYINDNIQIEYQLEPFHHIRLSNVFKQHVYDSLCNNFMSYINKTTPYKDQPGAVHDYAGYIYGMN